MQRVIPIDLHSIKGNSICISHNQITNFDDWILPTKVSPHTCSGCFRSMALHDNLRVQRNTKNAILCNFL